MTVAEELFKMWCEKPKEITAEPKKHEKKAVQKMPEKFKSKDFMQAIKSIQKSAVKYGIDEACATFTEGDFLYIHDNFRVVKSKHKFMKAGENVGGFDVNKFFSTVYKSNTKKLTAPAISELSEMVKKTRKDAGKRKPTRVLYQFKNGLTINADYLLEAMEITGSNKFTYSDLMHPLLFKSDDKNYEVIVCPVHSAEKFQGCRIA